MKKILHYITIIISILFSLNAIAQTDTKFWFVAPEVSADHGDSPVLLRITTATLPADVEISMPANTANFPTLNYSIAAQSTLTINLTTLGLQGEVEHFYDFLDGVPGKSNKGIYITSTNPVTCYYEVSRTNNCDIFALKGSNALGTEFFSVFQNNGYNMSSSSWGAPAYSALEIVAIEDGTNVTFESTQGQEFFGYGVGTFTITLDKGETFSIVPEWNTNVPTGSNLPTCNLTKYANDFFGRAGADHLSGVRITSTKNIAITKKDDSVRYYCVDGWGGGCYDLIGDQMVPLDILGKEYIAMRGGLTNAPENVYIAATEDNTDIFIDGVWVDNIDRGETYMHEFWASGNPFVHVRGDKKISVLHVSGFGCEVGGAILPPTDKCTGSTQVAITRSTSESFFINLMVWTGAQDEFYINGVLQDGSPGTFFGPGDFTPLPSSPNWLVWRSPNIGTANIAVGSSTLVQNTEDVFHLGVINGGSTSGCRFGYFSDFNELRVDAEATGSGSGEIRACSYEQIQLYASGGTTYDWWPANYLNDPSLKEPIADPPAGTSTIFYVEVSGACGLTDTANVTVTKFPHVEAQFSADRGNGCSPLDIELHETSTQVYELYWDFNFSDIGGNLDRDTILYSGYINRDTDTTFTHTFINTTNEADPDSIETYEIRLLVKNSNDCSDTAYASVIVYPEVTADFTLSDLNDTIGCNPHTVSYVDNSNNEDFYYWKFGDGVSSTAQNPTHEFTNILETEKVYNTELIVRSVHFCRDTMNMDITLHPYLEAGFTIDTYEGCSPLDVLINSNSVFEDSIVLVYGDGDTLKTGSFGGIVHTYENKSTTVDTNKIELYVFNDEGCAEVWYDTVIVYPEFDADYTIDGNDYTGCNSRTVTFTNTTNDGAHVASRYLWEFADGTSMDTTNATINKFYNNTTSGDKTYQFRLTARSVYGCTDDTTNSIEIYRAYANFTVDNNEGCAPVEVTIDNNSIGDDIPLATGWDWDYGNGHTDTDKDPFPYSYENTGFLNDTNYLVLTVTGTAGCSTKDSVQIVTYPGVKVEYTTALTSVASCDSLVATFTTDLFDPALPIVTYDWNFGDGATSSASDPVHTYKNLLSSTDIDRKVDLHVETDMGCSYDTSSFVKVYPMVRAKISVDKTEGCSPLSINTSAQLYPGNSSYAWNYDDGFTPNVSDPPSHTYPANPPGGNDVYTLTLNVEDATGNCTDTDTKTITVFDEALADFNPKSSTDCDPYTVTFDNLSQNAVSFKWNFDDGGTTSTEFEPTYEFVNPTSATKPFNVELEATSNEGCKHTFSSDVNVLPTIEADFDIDVSEGCSPLTVTISNNYVGNQCYWYWDKDDRIINTGAADSTVNFGTFTKTYINNSGSSRTDSLTLIVGNGNGCYEIYKRAITVHSTIDAEFDVSVDEGCNPLSVQFTNNTVNGSIYNWNFGDGSSTTTASPNKVFTNTTTTDKPFTVRLTAESAEGCVDTEDTVITVYSKVISGFSIATSEGCPPFTTTIENTSVGNSSDTYQWLIDNVAVAGAPTNKADFDHTYENNVSTVRDYEVKLIATNPHGCTSEHTDIVRVYEYVEASFSMDVNEGCTPLLVEFTDLSSVPTDTKYTWEFRDGATSGLSDPNHTFYNPSRTTDIQREVKLTVQSANYCSDDTSLTVDIYHQPLAKFYIDKTSSCPPLQSTITKLSQGEDSYEWRFGDGNTSTTDENFVYTWDNTDIDNIQYYNLELWVGTNNNCVDSTSLDVTVFPKVTADFTISDTAGCSPLEDVQFTNTSTSPATQFFWTFGDGSYTNIENPLHDFANITSVDRVYDIYLRASSEYNCFDDTTQHITVYRQPEAEFYIDPNYMTFPENTVGITNVTNPGPFDYFWEFGDINNSTSSEKDPNQFEYEHWGEKIIELTVTSQTNSDCFDYFSDTAIILPPKVNADFTTNINGGCVDGGLEVQFTAAGSAYNEEYQYDWEFGDGTRDQGQYVTHVYEEPGAYYVKLTARSREYTDVEEDYAYKTIYAYANPEVNFEVSPKLAMLDPTTLEARVKFYNLSTCNDTSGCAYTWDFGDGETAISTDVTHGYKELGKFDVSLTAVSVHGCRDSLTLYEEVEIIGAGQIAFPNAFTPDGFGPPENETFKPLAEGVIEYELFIYNRWGELIFTTKDLSKGWDGTIDGEPAKPDVYVWKAQGKYTNGKSFELAGDVTLIR